MKINEVPFDSSDDFAIAYNKAEGTEEKTLLIEKLMQEFDQEKKKASFWPSINSIINIIKSWLKKK